LSFVANAFAARGVADALALMQRVGDVIGQRALLENPLVVGSEDVGQGQQEKQREDFLVHRVVPHHMHAKRL
jgi:hypothetical protein